MSSKPTEKKQPVPKKGYEFNTWAVFNWGICLKITFRTRREAIKWCLQNMKGHVNENHTWKEMSRYMKVVKVKNTVL